MSLTTRQYTTMDKYTASKIVNQYVDAMADNGVPFKRLSSLMYSKEQIEEAFFVFMDEYMKLFRWLSEDFGAVLTHWYCMMDLFIEDSEADRLNGYLGEGLAVIGESTQDEAIVAFTMRLSKAVHDGELANHPALSKIRHALIKYARACRNGVYFDEINEHFGRCYEKYVTQEVLSLPNEERIQQATKRVRAEVAANDNEWWTIRLYRVPKATERKDSDNIRSKDFNLVLAIKLILKFAGDVE
jgi:hypothetical protein